MDSGETAAGVIYSVVAASPRAHAAPWRIQPWRAPAYGARPAL